MAILIGQYQGLSPNILPLNAEWLGRQEKVPIGTCCISKPGTPVE